MLTCEECGQVVITLARNSQFRFIGVCPDCELDLELELDETQLTSGLSEDD